MDSVADSMPPRCSTTPLEESKTSSISPLKEFYNNAGNSASGAGASKSISASEADENGIIRKVSPYKSSSKDYSLSPVDFDIVTRYRAWLADYFQNEFNLATVQGYNMLMLISNRGMSRFFTTVSTCIYNIVSF